ncbi:MAG TPA: long-chain fatty acid--CoA ligase [Solirubrobacteraceae bacterium]
MNVSTILRESARRAPDVIALVSGDRRYTYGELDALSARIAGGLVSAGVQPGDRVALQMPNVPEFVFAYWAILRAGAVVVPMNPQLKAREIEYYLADSGATAFLPHEDCATEALAAARPDALRHVAVAGTESFEALTASDPLADDVLRAPTDLAVILYTSGTTGQPKGACLTHSNIAWNQYLSATTLLHSGPDDVFIATLPLFHSFGQTVMMGAAFCSGAKLVLVARFEPVAVLESISRERATIFAGVPTMFNALLQQDLAQYDLTSLRRLLTGGASMAAELFAQVEQTLGLAPQEGYGLSETSPVASFTPGDRPKVGSIGRPMWGVEMRVVDADGCAILSPGEPGEIEIRGHNVMAGYLGKPEATAAAISDAGWFRTGDIGKVDEEGYFFVVDRKKDMIIRGGYNVYPREVEEVLYEHPAVLEVAVLGVPHEAMGEQVVAAVVERPGTTIDPAELIEFAKERLASYKYPREIIKLDALPKGPTGKILKRAISLGERREHAASVD